MSFDDFVKQLQQSKVKKPIEVNGYLIIPLDKKKVKEDYVMVFQDSLRRLAKMDLTVYEWKVLAFLLGITDFENSILITQQEIAEHTGIKQPDVSKTLKSLADKGLITIEKKGRQNFYRLNSLIAWKGRETNRQKQIPLETNPFLTSWLRKILESDD